ncbi:MAG: tail fiber protein [Bradyrhizobium sp.]|uniref:tail fiber protein n=1 Tax=Bradyrhizobium sp. TaxID=376 RepID=UPI003D147A58
MTANRIFPAGTEDYTGADYMDKVKEEGDKLWTFLTVPLDSISGTNTITATPRVPITSYVDGMKGRLIPANTNTGAVTMNWGPGAKDVLDAAGQPLTSGALVAGVLYVVEFISADNAFRVVSAAGGGGGGSGSGVATGTVHSFDGEVLPAGYLWCYGQAVSRSTYAALFATLCPVLGAFTVTIASPADVTLNGHGRKNGSKVRLFTTGALPTGLNVNTDYFVVNATANTFQLATTRGGSAINTSGSQSGTHTVQAFNHGAGNGSTTFNIPDRRGRGDAGKDDMGGTAASRLTKSRPQGVDGAVLGDTGGEQAHVQAEGEVGRHRHEVPSVYTTGSGVSAGTAASARQNNTLMITDYNLPADPDAANVVQPTFVTNKIIKT